MIKKLDSMSLRVAAFFGLSAMFFNVLAIFYLQNAASSYKPFVTEQWLSEIVKVPGEVTGSVISFILGVCALLPFAWILSRTLSEPLKSLVRCFFLIGVMFNAIGVVTPMIVVKNIMPVCTEVATCNAVAAGFLSFALVMDSAFNFFFGFGLFFLGIGLFKNSFLSRLSAGLSSIGGLLTVTVCLQFMNQSSQSMLYIAGPIWLLFLIVAAAEMLKMSFSSEE